MYLNYYQLSTKPFKLSPDSRFVWMGEKHKEALATLKYGILDNKGFLLLIGDVGTGKTTMINSLLGSLGQDVVTAVITDPDLEPIDFFNLIARAFGIQEKFRTKGDFLIAFSQLLHRIYSEGRQALLLVDEAQRLSPVLLEEIRLLSNIETEHTKLINIFFVGQPEFVDHLLNFDSRAIHQRITINYRIYPLDEKETAAYVQHRLKIGGTEAALFDRGALQTIFKYTQGYPRRINILCDRALLTGFTMGKRSIGKEIIKECARELDVSQLKLGSDPPHTSAADRPLPVRPTVVPSAALPAKAGMSGLRKSLYAATLLFLFLAGYYFYSQEVPWLERYTAAPVVRKRPVPIEIHTPPAPVAQPQPPGPSESAKPTLSTSMAENRGRFAPERSSTPTGRIETAPLVPPPPFPPQVEPKSFPSEGPAVPTTPAPLAQDVNAIYREDDNPWKASRDPLAAATPPTATQREALQSETAVQPSVSSPPSTASPISAPTPGRAVEAPASAAAAKASSAPRTTVREAAQTEKGPAATVPPADAGQKKALAARSTPPAKSVQPTTPPTRQTEPQANGTTRGAPKSTEALATKSVPRAPTPKADVKPETQTVSAPPATAKIETRTEAPPQVTAPVVPPRSAGNDLQASLPKELPPEKKAATEPAAEKSVVAESVPEPKVPAVADLAQQPAAPPVAESPPPDRMTPPQSLPVATPQTAKDVEGTAAQPSAPLPKTNAPEALRWARRSFEKLQSGQWDEAIRAATKAIEADPGLVDPYINRAWGFVEKGFLDQAIQDCNTALRNDPKSFLAYNNRGLAYHRKNAMDLAEADYARACELGFELGCQNLLDARNRREVDRLLNASLESFNARQWAQVITLTSQILAIEPENVTALCNRSAAYCELGLLQKGLADGNRAVTLAPNSGLAYNNRGYAYELLGQRQNALRDYKKSCALGFQLGCDNQDNLAIKD